MKNFVPMEEAIRIAKKWNEKVNKMQEFTDGYYFYIDDGIRREGGGDCGFLIEKNGGRILCWSDYFMDENRKIIEIGEVRDI